MADRHLDCKGGPADLAEQAARDQDQVVSAGAARCHRELEIAEEDKRRAARGELPLRVIRQAQAESERRRRFGR